MIEALIVPFWIPAFAGMTPLCREVAQGRQDGWTLFVIPDQIGNPEFQLKS